MPFIEFQLGEYMYKSISLYFIKMGDSSGVCVWGGD